MKSNEPISDENYFPQLPSNKGSLEPFDSVNERIYHLDVVIKIAFMAAMGGFLFGYKQSASIQIKNRFF